MHFINSVLFNLADAGLWVYGLIFLIGVLESLAFIGLLVPGTTVIIVAGVLAAQGLFSIQDLVWPVIAGSIVGDAISFYLGHRGIGWFKSDRRFFKREYFEKGEAFFIKHGPKSVFLARFIGPLRPVVPFVAGLTRMPLRRFFFYKS